MHLDDISQIESHLGVALPTAYQEALLASVENSLQASPYFKRNPTEIIIANLELRMTPVARAFADGPWPANEICIGSDGCGNYYSISAGNADCAVRFFNHESNEFENIAESLDAYFEYLSKLSQTLVGFLASRPDNHATPSQSFSDSVQVTRVIPPRHSVLDPISMDEWETFVDADPDLLMRGYRTSTNPFTKEETRIARPGLAVLPAANSDYEFVFAYGRISVNRPGEAALAKLENVAAALNAKLSSG